MDDTLLRQSASNRTLATAIISSLTTGPGYPGETDDVTPNVVDDGAGSSGTAQAAADVRARAAAATQCHGYLSNPNRIYYGSVHLGTITKTVGGWCADGYTILSVTNWGHLVPWMNPSYPQYCWSVYRVGHGPEGSWHYDKGANHSTWAHGYIIDQIGFTAGSGCQLSFSGRNWWSIIRFSAQVNPFYWDGYNDFGFRTTY